ncbi:Nucleolar GTP-binding protein 1 [Nowakowskiella sp. JEL0407]|nr:Nucleolar GTP-binding protein 1 [Nowakowskiella sp. JEL0407]
MATAMKRQKDPLQYLERVRQHLGRLPSIDPNTRTLLICGYPNVGKSSFINKLTKADVDVQPYAFTTKSLFVGHMDYKNLRWQVIDTPGILDHPLEQRNTIEMQSITALAHLRSAILYFMDLSEQCGYSVKEQMKLFHSIKPLFANKPTFVMFNKIDIVRPDQIGEEDKALLKEMENDGVKFMQLSCHTEEGVMEVRDKTCDELLAMRVETRMKAGKVGDNILNRLHLAQPAQRDEVSRPAFIPEAVLNRTINPDRKLERDIELENGGAGVYNINLKKNYDLKNHEWKFDVIPEIMDGKNVADFFDADIEKKLAELEAEEARLEAEGFYDVEEYESEEEEEVEKPVREKAGNRPTIPRKHVARQSTTSKMVNQLKEAGISVDEEAIRGRSLQRKRARSQARETSEMDVDSKNEDVEMEDTDKHKKLRSQSKPRTRTASRDRSLLGVKDVKQKEVADKIKFKKQRMSNLMARAGEADRHISTKMPKHLFAGKRKSGKTDRR